MLMFELELWLIPDCIMYMRKDFWCLIYGMFCYILDVSFFAYRPSSVWRTRSLIRSSESAAVMFLIEVWCNYWKYSSFIVNFDSQTPMVTWFVMDSLLSSQGITKTNCLPKLIVSHYHDVRTFAVSSIYTVYSRSKQTVYVISSLVFHQVLKEMVSFFWRLNIQQTTVDSIS